MIVYLVRHGKTKWNLEERIQGWADSPLLPDDKSPEKAAEKLKGIHFDYVCSSDLGRAVETKRRILEILGIENEENEHPEFREVGFGVLEGMPISVLKDEYADLWRRYKTYSEDFVPSDFFEGFESVKDVKTRALGKLNEIKKIYGEDSTILVIAHGSIMSILEHDGKEIDEPAVIIENGGVLKLEI
ncbi:histidine phosphatase family protein [Streptobacillus moniliformis]|uniref:Phosphoglycerate mutase n=1 Tax=Streptobacillus moniliformis (strain ATCC 14647 / DSM 12112 / NCTC 10651 / 9901) TaxID=519441 RepID=D1AVQ4_STRM9|nr:histidine phosphatase family protein [Streptobacillus moniliformis]ACZ01814.1 Phosphoglycerate mutase [Streptobacillus moniliformis DSM 12112]AVL43192.1 histidine phosphatase family protein [Streptobacillus moniliformis]SQA12988.1 Alpha-ribazole phosphatase [Streptobacillus moniliformis]